MQRIISFLKQNWLFIVLALIATLLTILWYFKPPQTKPPQLPTLNPLLLPGEALTAKTQVNFQTQPTVIQAPILNLKRTEVSDVQQITTIAKNLGFTEEPIVIQDYSRGAMYKWYKSPQSLTISPLINEILFDTNLLENLTTQSQQFPPLEKVNSSVGLFLETAGLSPTTLVNTPSIRYLAIVGSVIASVDQNTASILEVSYPLVVNNTNFVGSDPRKGFVQVWVNKDNQVLRLNWQQPIESFSIGQVYPLKNFNEIQSLVNSEGTVALAELPGEGISGPPILSLTINSIELAYYLPNQESITQPIFILKGIAYQANQKSYPAWVYLPAIKSQYFHVSPTTIPGF